MSGNRPGYDRAMGGLLRLWGNWSAATLEKKQQALLAVIAQNEQPTNASISKQRPWLVWAAGLAAALLAAVLLFRPAELEMPPATCQLSWSTTAPRLLRDGRQQAADGMLQAGDRIDGSSPYRCLLPQRGELQIDGDSQLIVEQLGPDWRFHLVAGQAWVELTALPGSERFQTRSDQLSVAVTGTRYHLDADRQRVAVEQGQVIVSTATQQRALMTGERAMVAPSGQLQVSRSDQQAWTSYPLGSGQAAFGYLSLEPKQFSGPVPLLVYLHGADGCGPGDANSLQALGHLGPLALAAEGLDLADDFEAMIVLPQRSEPEWTGREVAYFVSALIEQHPVDTRRIVLMGPGTGGGACWKAALGWPDLFAGIVPISGSCQPSDIRTYPDVDIWAIHAWDEIVYPPAWSQQWCAGIAERRHGAVPPLVLPNELPLARSVAFDPKLGWQWRDGYSPPPAGCELQLSLLPGDRPTLSKALMRQTALWRWVFSRRRADGR